MSLAGRPGGRWDAPGADPDHDSSVAAGPRGSRPGPRRGALLLLAAGVGLGTAAADFEVATGYLSTNAQTLATDYGWSLVWEASEDRLIEHPFAIANDSLQGALEGLLGAYQGQFVADLYRSNEVVVVSTPLPQLQVVLPGAALPEAPSPGLDERVSDDAAPSGNPGAVAAAAPADGEALLADIAGGRIEVREPPYEAAASGQDAAAGLAGAQ